MKIEGIRKCLVFSLRYSWRSIRQYPLVSAFLLFVLFLYIYLPSIFSFIVYSSPVIACTALLLGALLVYGEPDEPEDVKSVVDLSVKVAETEERSRDFDVLKKGERYISEVNAKKRQPTNVTKEDDGDGDRKDSMDLAASSSSKIAEKEVQTEKTLTNGVEARDLEFIEKELFSIESSAYHEQGIAEGLKVETEQPLDNQFDSSLGSPWLDVNNHGVSSDSESDESDGEESLSPDTSMTDIVPIIDELHPLLESANLQPAHRSIDTSDATSRASSPEREFEDASAEEETENQADEEDEEAQEEKDNNEAVVKWTADDQKNLLDLGSSELERNQRLENLIAKRRAKKLQRFQTDKNLIDLDTEPLPFMEDISRLNVQVPAISAPRSNPFDLPFDSEESLGQPIPGSAPSVLLPRRNPFDLPYYQNEESSNVTGENPRPYDASFSQRDTLTRRIDRLNLGAVSDDASQEKSKPKLKPYFVPEKMSEPNFASFESQLSEESDSEGSSASESDSASAVFNQDHELSKYGTHQQVSYVNQDVDFVEQEIDLSFEVGSANLEQEGNGADAVEEEIGDLESSSPVSSAVNLEVIDERYDGSSSSSCSEDVRGTETNIHIEPINSAHMVGDSQRSFDPTLSVVKPDLPGDGAEVIRDDSQVGESGLSGKGVGGGADDRQIADPVYDSSPNAKSSSHIASLEALFSNIKGKEGFSTGPSLASDLQANLHEVFSTPKAFEHGTTLEEGDFMLVRESIPPVSQNYIDQFVSDQENVVDKVKGLNEVSDEAKANLREIKSVSEVSDSGKNLAENFHVEDLSDGENGELQPKLDQQSVMEQPLPLGSDPGSSVPFDGNLEMKNAKLHIPEPSVIDTKSPAQQSSQEIAASCTSGSTFDNSEALGDSPKSLNSKDGLGHPEYEVNKNQSEAD
ncbi:hypothetical protein KFK09_021967 [Dendrobium nobile]|uniref:Uncharacterized protein n=1 Tax=Dendrobium nobile TaxID=94219 RepID=A0A8T3AHY4_DENNO|nr:hypothetical protein KFK09_021967 [Dendrobium nobile]